MSKELQTLIQLVDHLINYIKTDLVKQNKNDVETTPARTSNEPDYIMEIESLKVELSNGTKTFEKEKEVSSSA